MAYGSTPHVGLTPKKMAAALKVHKWHARNVSVRLVNSLHEPYQALPSASIGNGNITFAGKHHKVPDRQVAKTGKSSIFWLLSPSLSHASTITVEAITTIQTWKHGTNHWLLHSPPTVLKELGLVGVSSTLHVLVVCLPLYAIFLKGSYVIGRKAIPQLTTWYINFRREVDSCWIYEFIWSECIWITD